MSSTPSPGEYRCFVGVDITAASFTAIWTTDGRMQPKAVTFSQSTSGFAAFQQHLQATHVAPTQTLIVLEATGSYWIALAVTLHEAGYAVAVLNPPQLHNYAQSLPRAVDATASTRRFRQFDLPCPFTVDSLMMRPVSCNPVQRVVLSHTLCV